MRETLALLNALRRLAVDMRSEVCLDFGPLKDALLEKLEWTGHKTDELADIYEAIAQLHGLGDVVTEEEFDQARRDFESFADTEVERLKQGPGKDQDFSDVEQTARRIEEVSELLDLYIDMDELNGMIDAYNERSDREEYSRGPGDRAAGHNEDGAIDSLFGSLPLGDAE